MKTLWIVGIVLLWFLGTIISLGIEGNYVDTNTTDSIFALMRPDFGSFSNPLSAIGGFFIFVWSWIQALWIMFWFDYSFLTGDWEILKYLGWTISLGTIVTLVLAVRGTGSN